MVGTPLTTPRDARTRRALRVLLSYYVSNGLEAALGLLVISGLVHVCFGEAAAAAASIGVIVCIPPDAAAPRRGKFWVLLPAAVFGVPLFAAVQWLHEQPLLLGLLVVPATFVAFLAGAWGKRGLPISMSIMFAMVFSMAVPYEAGGRHLLDSTRWFAAGAASYLLWATAANSLLNNRYRAQVLADTLLSLAALMRVQAELFIAPAAGGADSPTVGRVLLAQAALADQLQATRDLVLESPRTPRRQQLAGLLLHVLELRDHLLASELDLDALQSQPGHAAALADLRTVLLALADDVEGLADALLQRRVPPVHLSRRVARPATPAAVEATPTAGQAGQTGYGVLASGLANRVGHIDTEVGRATALARGEAQPDLALVRAAWQAFVSPTAWSWLPLAGLWRWEAPPLRHAVRAALAIATAYAISVALPWGTHDYWILLTIVVVLRGSLAQTLERRNSRVAGTLLGCLLTGVLLNAHLPGWTLLLLVTLAQAFAHAFALKRYLVTAVAATVLGLMQSHLMNTGSAPVFDMAERLFDTLLGVSIAWAFSYVLPSWERHQIPALVARVLAAQARHARVALGLGQLDAVDNQPELEWRLARREVYDSLSALAMATHRSLVEPRAVRPPLLHLSRLLAHSQQLLAQLTVVKTMLLMQRGRLRLETLREPLAQAASTIEGELGRSPSAAAPAAPGGSAPDNADVASGNGSDDTSRLPDAADAELNPWALRRLRLACGLAQRLRGDADAVLGVAGVVPVRPRPAAAP